MQAVWTAMQALLTGVGIIVLALLGGSTEAWIGAGTGTAALLAALLCNRIYAGALAQRKRTEERAVGDRRRAVAMLIALPLPTAYAVCAASSSTLRAASSVLAEDPISALVACLVVIALALLYVSSSVDWYIIKGWRDGVVSEPPCMRKKDRPTWLLITRVWLLHRIVATIGFFVGLWTLVGLAWFELAKHHGGSDWAIYLLGLVSPSAIPLFFMRHYIVALGHAVGLAFGNLPIALGDEVGWTDEGAARRGIVYDVSIDGGYRMIKRDGQSSYLPLARVRDTNVSVDEGEAPSWACQAVKDSQLMGAADRWEPHTRSSGRWLILH
ncbi:MAG: hypothetical protein JWM73_954 [Solirubrobacterales bacterium]|nr:hypothetical protein [Solirubrobacterales bacterium]